MVECVVGGESVYADWVSVDEDDMCAPPSFPSWGWREGEESSNRALLFRIPLRPASALV